MTVRTIATHAGHFRNDDREPWPVWSMWRVSAAPLTVKQPRYEASSDQVTSILVPGNSGYTCEANKEAAMQATIPLSVAVPQVVLPERTGRGQPLPGRFIQS